MRCIGSLVLLMTACAAADTASAQAMTNLAPFRSVELQDGGQVTIRPGPAQTVTLVEGDADDVRVVVDDGRLRIHKCPATCTHRPPLRIEIVTPPLESLAVRDGGRITMERGFPRQPVFAATVFSGGLIDMRAVDSDSVSASIAQGGMILTRPLRQLDAAISHGGAITYWGDARVRSAISDGGVVQRGRAADADRPITDLVPPPPPPVPPIPPSPKTRS